MIKELLINFLLIGNKIIYSKNNSRNRRREFLRIRVISESIRKSIE